MYFIKVEGMVVRLMIFFRAMWWSMVSNALLRSRATVTVRSGGFFLLNLDVIILLRVRRVVFVECPC